MAADYADFGGLARIYFPVKTLEETEKHLKARYSELQALCLKTDNIPIGYVRTEHWL